eukprot:5901147-Amphidinium_carterae.1
MVCVFDYQERSLNLASIVDRAIRTSITELEIESYNKSSGNANTKACKLQQDKQNRSCKWQFITAWRTI